MFPKLYIVESKERDSLVKIESAGTGEKSTSDDVVYGRVRSYATGISDNSIVHEAYGHKIFESYLHEFVRDSRKEIEVSFLANVYRPEE